MRFPGRNKFNATRTVFMGATYHSKGEAKYAADLELQRKAGTIKRWERQLKIPLMVNNKLIANYIMDFVVEMNDGSIEFHEYKGMETAEWKMKWRLLEAVLPDIYDPGISGKPVKMVLINHRIAGQS